MSAEVLPVPAPAVTEEAIPDVAHAACVDAPACVDDSAADVAQAAQPPDWRCWCSAVNCGIAAACDVCTTPRDDDDLDTVAVEESKGHARRIDEAKSGKAGAADAPCATAAGGGGGGSGGAAAEAAATPADAESAGAADTDAKAVAEVYGLALVVPADCGLGAGKLAEQCCLAMLAAVWRVTQGGVAAALPLTEDVDRASAVWWHSTGKPTRVLSCESAATLTKLQARAAVCGLPTATVGGRQSGNSSVLAVGPASAEELELVTGQLAPLAWRALPAVEGQGMDAPELAAQRAVALGLVRNVLATCTSSSCSSTGSDSSSSSSSRSGGSSSSKAQKPNAVCLCGSGKKYKKCCSVRDQAEREQHAALLIAVDRVLGKDAAAVLANAEPAGGGGGCGLPSSSAGERRDGGNLNAVGRVAAYRKQGEFGAKKYIKP
jgi:peptidyl-tRNA hydrolase